MISPTLTTVKQDCALRAKIALQKLREMKENLFSETEIMLPVTLVKRAITKEVKD